MNWTFADIFVLVLIILAIVIAVLYFLNKWAYKKMNEQQDVMDRTRQTATIFIIDKKRDKAENASLPKAVKEQFPWYSKMMKMYFVRAKIGPQIVTLICDKKVFNALPVKKNAKVDISGMYITSMKGMKSDEEMKAHAKQKKEKAKAEKKVEKSTGK